MIRWLHNIFGTRPPVTTAPLARPLPVAQPQPTARMVDVAHAAMQSQAANLTQLVADGVPMMRRRQRRERARQKVLASLRLPVGDNVVDEVTERIVEVAEFDPRIAKWIE